MSFNMELDETQAKQLVDLIKSYWCCGGIVMCGATPTEEQRNKAVSPYLDYADMLLEKLVECGAITQKERQDLINGKYEFPPKDEG